MSKLRSDADVLGTYRDNSKKIPGGNRMRALETLALSRPDEEVKIDLDLLDLCACRNWGRECERGVEKKGIIFCGEKKPECVARGKERR